MTGTVDRTLEDMGITLPEVKPAGNYELFTRSGSTLFLSGHLPKTNEGELIKGKVGEDIDVGKAAEAAKVVAVNLIATIKAACGDLDKVRILKITGFVNSGADFTSQPLVVNGASDMLVSIFGKEKGAHARSAVGVGSLPFGVCVEIEAIIEVLP